MFQRVIYREADSKTERLTGYNAESLVYRLGTVFEDYLCVRIFVFGILSNVVS